MTTEKEILDFLGNYIGLTEEEVLKDRPKAIDIFDVDKPETKLDDTPKGFSSVASTPPDENFAVGKLREKETEITKGKTGTTYLAPAKTESKEIQDLAKKIKGEGELITPDEVTPDLERKIQESRTRIEKDIPAGTTFTNLLSEPLEESFEAYYNRVKKDFPASSLEALKAEAAKQYAMRYPEYKALAKNPDLLEAIVSEANFNVDDYIGQTYEKGMKVRSKKPSGVRAITTEALENAGYITKDINKAIDKSIETLIDDYPQQIEAQFQYNPETGKPYTKTQVKRLIKNRFLFAAAKYFNEGVKPKMIEEIMEEMRGSYANYNATTKAKIIADKIRPKYITPFLTSMLGVIKTGQASDLLMAGTKASGLGLLLEVPFMQEAEAADLFTKDELSELTIAEKFGGIESLQKKEAEMLKQKELENIKRKEERDYDVYESAGIPTFPEYLFSLGKAELDMSDK